MKGDKISVSESREYVNEMGLRRWKKYSRKTTVQENETEDEAADRCEQFIEKRFQKFNPLSDSSGDMVKNFKSVSVTNDFPGRINTVNLAHERLKEKIDDCASLKELMEFIANSDIPEEVRPYVEQKKKQLS